MTLLDKVHDALPGLPDPQVYDDGFPNEAAGHIEAGPFTSDGDITTPHGVDAGFDGDNLPSRDGRSGGEEAGSERANRRIDETVEQSKRRHNRHSVSETSDDVVYGNETLPDTTPRRILIRNTHRKAVTVTNQGASLIAIGKGSSISITGGIPSPNAVYLPAGTGRTFTHRKDVWVVGAAGGIVDWVEENYERP